MDWVGDTFQDSWFGPRNKYVHTVGNVAKCKYVPSGVNHNYTGIFEGGSDHCIIRLSTAAEPNAVNRTSPQEALGNFIPGVAIKFLRDGVHSGNMVFMYSAGG